MFTSIVTWQPTRLTNPTVLASHRHKRLFIYCRCHYHLIFPLLTYCCPRYIFFAQDGRRKGGVQEAEVVKNRQFIPTVMAFHIWKRTQTNPLYLPKNFNLIACRNLTRHAVAVRVKPTPPEQPDRLTALRLSESISPLSHGGRFLLTFTKRRNYCCFSQRFYVKARLTVRCKCNPTYLLWVPI